MPSFFNRPCSDDGSVLAIAPAGSQTCMFYRVCERKFGKKKWSLKRSCQLVTRSTRDKEIVELCEKIKTKNCGSPRLLDDFEIEDKSEEEEEGILNLTFSIN